MSYHPSGPPAHAALCAAVLSLSTPLVSAQAESPASQRVVVTAARTEQALPDALPSTRVVTRAEIEAVQAPDLPGLLRALTSIDVAQTGPLGAQTSLFLRGADSRQVLVLVDGVPFARADFGTASWQYLPPEQIERIEIVRGNHSALYGASAIGGVVHVITRRAERPQAGVGVGTQGTRLAHAAGGAQWGQGDTATRLAASLSTRRTDGFSARDPKQDPRADPDRDAARQSGASARLEQGWAPGHRTQLALSASRTASEYDGFTPDAVEELTTRVNTLALSTRHALGAGLSLQAEAGQTRESFDDPTGFTPEADNRVRNLAATLGWSATPDHDLQFGVESRRERYDEPAAAERRRTTNAVRLGWQGRIGPAWQVQAHARRDRSSAFGSAGTGLVAVGYAISPGWRASLQASSGFSPPSFVDELFDGDPSTALRAERSRQAEAALQWRDGAASVRAALFAARQRDKVVCQPIPGDPDFRCDAINIARAKNRGLELIAQWPLAIGQLAGELTLQDPRDAGSDTPLKRRAKQSLALAWQGDVAGWSLRAGVRHSGRRLDTDPVSFANAYARARTTLALGAAREVAPGWRFAASLDNAADSRRPEVLGYTAPPRAFLLTLQGTLR